MKNEASNETEIKIQTEKAFLTNGLKPSLEEEINIKTWEIDETKSENESDQKFIHKEGNTFVCYKLGFNVIFYKIKKEVYKKLK